jgi:hypothetical protein
MSQATFGAKRTYSSGELLALRRQQVERSQTRPPSISLQDSSELTARMRKMASVLPDFLPSQGNSTNMVKWQDSSVVQAMREGQSYRTSAVNREPRTDKNTCCQVPIPFLRPDFAVATTPKAIGCSRIIEEEQRVYPSFDIVQHFGLRKNDNKVVMANMPAEADGRCRHCNSNHLCIKTININPFTSFLASDWTVNNHSSVSGNTIILMQNTIGRSGSAFYDTSVVNISRPFTLTSTVTLRGLATPGNGFCIVFATNPSFIGGGGGDTGFLNGTPGIGYGLFVDTYGQDNPGTVRRAYLIESTKTYLTRNTESDAYTDLTNTGTDIVNATTGGATVVLTYDGTVLTASITLLSDPSKTDTVSATVNLGSKIGSSTAYFGATAGSGSAYQLTTLTGMQFYQSGTC